MAISILFLEQSDSHAEPITEKIMYRLSLDRSFSYICPDVKKCKRFLSVLAALTNDREEIIYRQDVIKDFEKNPTLLEQLASLSARFEELRISQKTIGKDEYRLNTTGTASSVASKNILQAQALSLKRALLFVKAYGELLVKHDLKSSGLLNLYNACKKMYESPEFSKLITFCSKYENFNESGFWDFKFTLNSEGRIEEYAMIDHRYIHMTDPELKRKGFSLFKKAAEITYPCIRLSSAEDGLYESLSVSAFSDLSGLFGCISEQIFAKFGSIGQELDFYCVVLKYIKALSEKKVPICYPVFSDDRRIKVKNLYDLYLLTSKPNTSEVVSNDFVMETSSGLLVFGNNGSGKTVYLRSVGTMQILAQAGLPIPCEYAEIALFSQIATQFSEAEKESYEGNYAGRFEQEVRELSAMVNNLKKGALVFLNETFQSTAYAEGAEGLYYLLKHFSALNIRWVLVSHLRQIEKMFDSNEATVLYTAEGYKISK